MTPQPVPQHVLDAVRVVVADIKSPDPADARDIVRDYTHIPDALQAAREVLLRAVKCGVSRPCHG